MKQYLPVLVYLTFAIIYQIVAKSAPSSANPFAMLALVYTVAMVGCTAAFFLTKGEMTFLEGVRTIPWSALVLGIAVIALEASTIYAYRLGWEVSVYPTVTYTLVIIAVLFVGALLFHEKITLRKVIGIALCISGIIVINTK